ncbi:hypothetical protein HGRIS_007201 [Hohenbuehelia grisea]|uniref:Uncharacterized protein n=1 Tax=Hohenbuehelia grisea TaxID=104357 RepID=A0ABR3JD11_9AGAR
MLFNSRLLVSLVVITVLGVSEINAIPIEGANGALVRRAPRGGGGGHGGGSHGGGSHGAGSHGRGGSSHGTGGFGHKVVTTFKKISKAAYEKGKAAAKKKIDDANKPGAFDKEAEKTVKKYVKKKAKNGKEEFLEVISESVSSDMPLSQPGCRSEGNDGVQVEFDDDPEQSTEAVLGTIGSKFLDVVRPEDLCPELAYAIKHAPTSQIMPDGRVLYRNDKTDSEDMGYYANDGKPSSTNRKSVKYNIGDNFTDPAMRAKFVDVVATEDLIRQLRPDADDDYLPPATSDTSSVPTPQASAEPIDPSFRGKLENVVAKEDFVPQFRNSYESNSWL